MNPVIIPSQHPHPICLPRKNILEDSLQTTVNINQKFEFRVVLIKFNCKSANELENSQIVFHDCR